MDQNDELSEANAEEMEQEQSSSDDDEDDNAAELQLEARAAELEKEINSNIYLYDVHVELVDSYKKLADLKSMRAAYERFAEVFPLTPTIWLTWLRDEITLANTPTEHKHVIKLFDKAVQDYLSIDLWLEYIQFALGCCELEETREILERGVTAVGLHTSQGSLLWDTFREIELAHLALAESLSDAWHQQAATVFQVFKRQLSVPLLNMQATYQEWREWYTNLPEGHRINDDTLEWNYKKALKLLQTYEPHEAKLLEATTSDEERYNAYKNYIKDVSHPPTILCLYERAIAQMNLNSSAWYDYCMRAISLGAISVDVSKRALRNCPWNEALWVARIRILEKNQQESQVITACFEQAVQSVAPNPALNLWLAYAEYVKRNDASPDRIHKLLTQAREQLGNEGDPTCKLLRWEARLYARNGDMKNARRLWNKILHLPAHAGVASAWLELCNLERQYGADEDKLRATFQHALAACADWPQYIADEWTMFERECGTVDTMLECAQACEKTLGTVAQTAQTVCDETATARNGTDRKGKKRAFGKGRDEEVVKKTKTASLPYQIVPHAAQIDFEKAAFLSNMRGDVDEAFIYQLFPNATAICRPLDRKGVSRCYAYVQFNSADDVEAALKRDREKIDGRPLFVSRCKGDRTEKEKVFHYSTQVEKNKLFVRGLPYNYSEADIKAIFDAYNPQSVRLVLHKTGKSKGFAYVDFESEKDAEKAMAATDKMKINEFVISVVISAPPPKTEKVTFPKRDTNVPRPRLKTSLIPNALLHKPSEPTSSTSAKTNDDFRKMFLNN